MKRILASHSLTGEFVFLFVLARAGTNCSACQGNGTAGKVTNFIDSMLLKACSGMSATVSLPLSGPGYLFPSILQLKMSNLRAD